ncbi:MAG: hypothetical protein IPH79_05690 [Sphingomonadales bacterium]|nr:hypothetical protein [Sphingomonadales bacterium]
MQKAVGTSLSQDYLTYTYTPNGRPATVKDANGNLAQYSYDGHDRQTRWTSLRRPAWARSTRTPMNNMAMMPMETGPVYANAMEAY